MNDASVIGSTKLVASERMLAAMAARRQGASRKKALPAVAPSLKPAPIAAPKPKPATRRPPRIAPEMIELARTTRDELARRFPLCFMPRGEPKRPLAAGIREDLIAAAPDLDVHAITIALCDYCNGKTYLAEIVEAQLASISTAMRAAS